jgi:hypothetical protein
VIGFVWITLSFGKWHKDMYFQKSLFICSISLVIRAEIHHALLSRFSLLTEVLIVKVLVKDRHSRVLKLVNLNLGRMALHLDEIGISSYFKKGVLKGWFRGLLSSVRKGNLTLFTALSSFKFLQEKGNVTSVQQ